MTRRHVQREGEGMDDDMRVERDLMVPMRDGIKLACDVYRPAAAGQIVPGAFPIGANLKFFFKAISNHAASSSMRNGRGMRPSSHARTSVS